jgi:enoyl-CoA hydratase/3-hydroxyacyl-CoA dehydrogenase
LQMSKNKGLRTLAVVGAGTMGSGIAQKMATEGFPVVLVDLDDEKVNQGIDKVRRSLDEGISRHIFSAEKAEQILSRLSGSSDWDALADADLVVEAVFENRDVKDQVFRQLETTCRSDAVLATNTSSFSVTDLAAGMKYPERMVGLHYFFHPAKNRLVEVVPGAKTDQKVLGRVWALQEQLGKIPIASADSYGFIVNRYFATWLNEAVRVAEEGIANFATIDAAATQTFGVGMGPFLLMNVTGIPIAMHTANTLGTAFGPFYAPAELLTEQVASGKDWDLTGELDKSKFGLISDRMMGAVFFSSSQLVDEAVGSIEDVDIGARVGLRWPVGPFEMANQVGVKQAAEMAARVVEPWNIDLPPTLEKPARAGTDFHLQLVDVQIVDGIATLTIRRPDVMNALNETVMSQLKDAFQRVAKDDAVRGIVIAGSGKAFVAGADIRFFLRNIDNDELVRTVEFTKKGQDLLREIDLCPKPVVARLHGLALGGGLELALACDHIVASEKAAMAFPETGIGIYPGLGGTQRTTRRVGRGLAKYLVLTGQMMSAREAAAIGLVDRVVAPEELDGAVREALEQGIVKERSLSKVPEPYSATAEFFEQADNDKVMAQDASGQPDPILAKAVKQLSKKAPIAVRLAGDLIDQGIDMPLDDALRLELDHLVEIFSTRDAYEGLSRIGQAPPVFKGQ